MSPIALRHHPALGLHRYVQLVAEAAGVDADACSVTITDGPATAYIALDARLTNFPTLDLALLWNEETGWAAALETEFSELIVLSYLGTDVLPAPRVVARFVQRLLAAEYPGQPHQPRFRTADTADDLADRLSRYAPHHP